MREPDRLHTRPLKRRRRVFLTDFGLSTVVAGQAIGLSRLTRTGETLGTPAYMSPEQARGDLAALSPASDAWGLGCVLYELLAARPAFDAGTSAAIVGLVLTEEPPPPHGVPEPVERLLGACLTKDPARRLDGAGAVRDVCERLLRGLPTGLRAPRRRAPRVLLAAAVVAAGVMGVWGATRPGVSAPPADTAPDVAEAAWALRHDAPDQARELLGARLAEAPEDHAARERLALLLWAAEREPEAWEHWAVLLDSGDAARARRARLYRGLMRYFARQASAATTELQAVGGVDDAEARLAGAALALMDDRWDDARAALREQPGWEAALLRGCVAELDPDGDPAEAVRETEAGMAEGIRFGWLYNNLGHGLLQLGEFVRARDALDQGIARLEGIPEPYYNRGLAHLRLRDYAAAIRDFDTVLTMDPQDARALRWRGECHWRRDDPVNAERDWDASLAIDAQQADTLDWRARARQARNDQVGALADAEAALALDPHRFDSLRIRGRHRVTQRDAAGGVADFTAALAERPADVQTHYDRGVARMALPDWAGALDDFAFVVSKKPERAEGHANQAICLEELGRIPEALAAYDAALAVATPEQTTAIREWRQGCAAKAR